jgi:hypothetical protein
MKKMMMMVLVAIMTFATTVGLTSCNFTVSMYDDVMQPENEMLDISYTRWKVISIKNQNGDWTDPISYGHINFRVDFQGDSYEASYMIPGVCNSEDNTQAINREYIFGGNYREQGNTITGYDTNWKEYFSLDVHYIDNSRMEAWLYLPELYEQYYVILGRE